MPVQYISNDEPQADHIIGEFNRQYKIRTGIPASSRECLFANDVAEEFVFAVVPTRCNRCLSVLAAIGSWI